MTPEVPSVPGCWIKKVSAVIGNYSEELYGKAEALVESTNCKLLVKLLILELEINCSSDGLGVVFS